jgi:holo-[acyl-carrier protein] synthase
LLLVSSAKDRAAVTLTAGIDIQSIGDVTDSIERFGDRYLTRILGDREIEDSQHHDDVARCLAMRFAAKEAVIKALEPHDHIPPWRTIEVIFQHRDRPQVVLGGEAALCALKKGITSFALSVGCTRGYAIATVIANVEEQ